MEGRVVHKHEVDAVDVAVEVAHLTGHRMRQLLQGNNDTGRQAQGSAVTSASCVWVSCTGRVANSNSGVGSGSLNRRCQRSFSLVALVNPL